MVRLILILRMINQGKYLLAFFSSWHTSYCLQVVEKRPGYSKGVEQIKVTR